MAESNEDKIIISRSHKGQIEDILKEKLGEKYSIVVAAGAGNVISMHLYSHFPIHIAPRFSI